MQHSECWYQTCTVAVRLLCHILVTCGVDGRWESDQSLLLVSRTVLPPPLPRAAAARARGASGGDRRGSRAVGRSKRPASRFCRRESSERLLPLLLSPRQRLRPKRSNLHRCGGGRRRRRQCCWRELFGVRNADWRRGRRCCRRGRLRHSTQACVVDGRRDTGEIDGKLAPAAAAESVAAEPAMEQTAAAASREAEEEQTAVLVAAERNEAAALATGGEVVGLGGCGRRRWRWRLGRSE